MMPLGIWNVHSANATTHHTLVCAFRTASVPAPLTRVSSRQRGGESMHTIYVAHAAGCEAVSTFQAGVECAAADVRLVHTSATQTPHRQSEKLLHPTPLVCDRLAALDSSPRAQPNLVWRRPMSELTLQSWWVQTLSTLLSGVYTSHTHSHQAASCTRPSRTCADLGLHSTSALRHLLLTRLGPGFHKSAPPRLVAPKLRRTLTKFPWRHG